MRGTSHATLLRREGGPATERAPEADGTILAAAAETARRFRARMPGHTPVSTFLGVAVLGDPGMTVEVRVAAFRD